MVTGSRYSVEVVNTGGNTFTATAQKGSFTLNTEGNGMGPLDALLSSLGSCIGYYIRLFCLKNGISLDGFSVRLESELTNERPIRFGEIRVDIDFKSAVIDEKTQAVIIAFVQRCPVHNTLKGDPHIAIKAIP